MSTRATARLARIEADAAAVEAGGAQGGTSGTPNTQSTSPTITQRTFGRTTGAGPVTVLSAPVQVPAGHSATVKVTVTAKVAVAGGADLLGDTFSFVLYYAFEDPAGTAALVPNVSGTAFVQASASRAADTVVAVPGGAAVIFTYTKVGAGTGTVDVTIETETQLN